ncbi:hypothetical protein EYZ11_007397 [Aspergillus tanneri]|uniref:Uncharacterized protein n=1 Tax=Aspergillus tanneri TaxID=1220188 RepID=A0A4S3JFB4_9EURO|nr:hypothetical protein EYZ11_007397 [Aspergillus tanneri]
MALLRMHSPKTKLPLSSFSSSQQDLRHSALPTAGSVPSYDTLGMFSQFAHPSAHQTSVYEMQSPQIVIPQHSYQQSRIFSTSNAQALVTAESSIGRPESTAEDLSEVLGELKIDETGIGKPYSRF